MSAHSGITASPELILAFRDLGLNVLVVRVSPDSTLLISDHSFAAQSADLDSAFSQIHSYLKQLFPEPAYVIIPLNADSYIFISFISDTAPIRQKMLYASTKNELLSVLGTGKFPKSHVFAWSELDEVSYEHYQFELKSSDLSALESTAVLQNTLDTLSSLSHSSPANPSLQRLASMESVGTGPKMLFLIDPKAQDCIRELKPDGNALIMLHVDVASETLKLTHAQANVSVDNLERTLIQNANLEPAPSYAVYNYAPKQVAFIYACPSGSKVKDRMMLAASKGGLVAHVNQALLEKGLEINVSVEIGDYTELEVSQFKSQQEQQPEQAAHGGLKFSKPKGPRRR